MTVTTDGIETILGNQKTKDYFQALCSYLEEYPPSDGHGVRHALNVAINSYYFASLNGYPNPEHLIPWGVFHDIYRPVRGEHGNEDQKHGIAIVKDLARDRGFDCGEIELVIKAMDTHDNWVSDLSQATLYEKVASLGDKASHNFTLVMSYAAASNYWGMANTMTKIYPDYETTLNAFNRYSSRAMKVFGICDDLKGVDLAVTAYQKIIDEVEHRISRPDKYIYEDDLKEAVNHTISAELEAIKLLNLDEAKGVLLTRNLLKY